MDKTKRKEVQKANDECNARSVEVADREACALELEKRIENEGEPSHLTSWIALGVTILGAAIGALSAIVLPSNNSFWRMTLIIAGGVLASVGGLWLLTLFLQKIRKRRGLQMQMEEAQERYRRGLNAWKDADENLKAALKPYGCDTWDAFEEQLGNFQKSQTDIDVAETTILAILGEGELLDELGEERKEASRHRRDIQEQMAEIADVPELDPVEFQKLVGEIEGLEKEKQRCQERILRLEALSETKGQTMENLHAMMEHRAALQRQLDLAVEKHKVYQMTLEGVRQVREDILEHAQHDLEPRLSGYLGILTQRNYTKAKVDENLRIQVAHGPRENNLIDIDDLSSGARDQVYLGARLALCDMIFQDAQPPLLMDDPFVKFDPARTNAALRLCQKLSTDRQIILFTCHDGYDRFADLVITLA